MRVRVRVRATVPFFVSRYTPTKHRQQPRANPLAVSHVNPQKSWYTT